MPLSPELLQPIAGENPGGASLRYEPVYDKIRRAREEEDEIPQGEWKRARKVADHAQVIKLATEVLTKQSKDLQVAAWLTEALLRRDGFAGLREGLGLLRAYIETFWDHLHPELEDGDAELRAAPLEWVGGYLDTAIRLVPLNDAGHGFADYKQSRAVGYEDEVAGDESKSAARARAMQEGKLTPEEFDDAFAATPKAWYKERAADLDGCLETVQALDELCGERFGRDAPSFMKLRDALQEVKHVAGQLLARKLEADPDPPEARTDAGEAGEDGGAPAAEADSGAIAGANPAGAAAAASVAVSARAAAQTSAQDAAAWVAAAARYLRGRNAMDPAPYLLLRALRWGELRAGGEPIDAKLLAAPDTEARTRLKTLLLDGEWSALLEAAEELMATPIGRGWLDLQRYVLTACVETGNDAVAGAIRGALRTLLRDLPGLLDMTLMDDSPTANAETRRWIEQEIGVEATSSDNGDSDPGPAVRDIGAPSRAPLGRAMERLRHGDHETAIEILMRAAVQEKSARARFLRRVQAARVMVDSGHESVAMPILKEMLEQIERHNLEEWESGETVAEALALLYRCYDTLEDDPSTKQSLYTRVARLDPMQAIRSVKLQADEQPGA